MAEQTDTAIDTQGWARFNCGCTHRYGGEDVLTFIYCQLHSAAPDLLNALRGLTEVLEAMNLSGLHGGKSALSEKWVAAQAAIEKTEKG